VGGAGHHTYTTARVFGPKVLVSLGTWPS
jgi:hypothetical protein